MSNHKHEVQAILAKTWDQYPECSLVQLVELAVETVRDTGLVSVPEGPTPDWVLCYGCGLLTKRAEARPQAAPA